MFRAPDKERIFIFIMLISSSSPVFDHLLASSHLICKCGPSRLGNHPRSKLFDTKIIYISKNFVWKHWTFGTERKREINHSACKETSVILLIVLDIVLYCFMIRLNEIIYWSGTNAHPVGWQYNRAADKVRIIISRMPISSPNPMFDHLLESSYLDNSNKRSNIGFGVEITQA